MSQFRTPVEVAALLRITKPTLRIWIKQGLIPAPIAIGRKRLFDVAELSRALKNLRAGTPIRGNFVPSRLPLSGKTRSSNGIRRRQGKKE